jgi:hypothetical protein
MSQFGVATSAVGNQLVRPGNQRSEYEIGIRWSPLCKNVSPEAKERPCWMPLPSNLTKDTSL